MSCLQDVGDSGDSEEGGMRLGKVVGGTFVATILLWVAFWGTVLWIAIHFLRKWW